jgi:2-keto-3-deoxy-L-rhamnonate aldolase RhmA
MKSVVLAVFLGSMPLVQGQPQGSTAIELWNRGSVAFGIFVPTDAAARTAAFASPLYDFLFLNQEPRYDAASIKTAVQRLRAASAGRRKTLIVRIPPLERDGADATRARITEAFALGADGVTMPHVRNVDEARQLLSFFRETGLSFWSSSNPRGDKLAMLMIEDPGALSQAADIADLKGYSILACGIGSLRQALGGDRAAAEAGNQTILAETRRAKLVNMHTTTPEDVEERVRQGYLALIATGPEADEAIRKGRIAADQKSKIERQK